MTNCWDNSIEHDSTTTANCRYEPILVESSVYRSTGFVVWPMLYRISCVASMQHPVSQIATQYSIERVSLCFVSALCMWSDMDTSACCSRTAGWLTRYALLSSPIVWLRVLYYYYLYIVGALCELISFDVESLNFNKLLTTLYYMSICQTTSRAIFVWLPHELLSLQSFY